jgi:hypothetical protein
VAIEFGRSFREAQKQGSHQASVVAHHPCLRRLTSTESISMSQRLRSLAVISTLLPLVASRRATAQAKPAEPWSLVNVRYDTESSAFVYAVYGHQNVFAMVGLLDNSRTAYTELLGGLGTRFSTSSTTLHYVAVAAAKATDAWYAQVYWLPSARVGAVTTRATVEWYASLERAGVAQLYVTPLSSTLRLTRQLEAGAAFDLAAARGTRTSLSLGPELRLSIPRAVLGADVFNQLTEGGTRFRMFFVAAF